MSQWINDRINCLLINESINKSVKESMKELYRRNIRLIESNDKMSLSKKIYLYRDFAAGVYLSEAPSPPRFLFGVVKQFNRFWIWSDT